VGSRDDHLGLLASKGPMYTEANDEDPRYDGSDEQAD